MPNQRYRLRSELGDLNVTLSLLAKIRENLFEQSNRVVFEVKNPSGGFDRINSSLCTNVVVNEQLAADQIQFKRPGGSAVEYYDITDITDIRRLRTKKHLIQLNYSANPAVVTSADEGISGN